MTPQQFARLAQIVSQPTAPFREGHVIHVVCEQLEQAAIPWFHDPHGNIIVGVASQREYLRRIRQPQQEPVRVFIAHMDHPGFHGQRWVSDKHLAIRWYGGSPIRHVNGARVFLANEAGICASGTLSKVTLHPRGYAIQTAVVRLQDGTRQSLGKAKDLFGAFQFRKDLWQSGRRLYMRAADDLVGVFSILETARHCLSRNPDAPFIGLLTRAEEVGFIGAIAHLELGWLQQARRPVCVVSLEASRTLPNAIIGKGPVVRLGDRRTVFDAAYLNVLTELAEKKLQGRYQRRVMDGGVCEATAATAYGFNTIGITVPLGNYHNQGFEGGADCRRPLGPAPEFIHLDDIDGELTLCKGLMQRRLPWQHAWRNVQRRLAKGLQDYATLLRDSR